MADEDAGQVVLVERPSGRRELVDAERRVIVAEVVEIAGDHEVRLVGDRPFAAHVEPAVAGDQAVEPLGEDVVGDLAIAPEPGRDVAGLRSAQAAAGAIDAHHRVVAEVEPVQIAEVGLALGDDVLEAPLDQLLRRRDADLPGLVEGDQHGGVDEAARIAVGTLGAGPEVVVAPAPLGRLVAGQAIVLAADQLLDPGLCCALSSGRRPCMRTRAWMP